MIHITNNLLKETELSVIQNICENFETFEVDSPKGNENNNSYNRVFVDDAKLQTYYHDLINYLEQTIDKNKFEILEFPKPKTWINKVIPETNKNDSFHYDMSFLTAITYLNEDFIGGEFTYINEFGGTTKLNPKMNKTLIMDKNLYHKVSPVLSGVRFSLVTFFNFNAKNTKTIV